LPQVVEEVTKPATWPHKLKVDEPRSTGYQGSRTSSYNEPYFQSAFRKVINRLGAILAEFGLQKGREGLGEEWKSAGQGQYEYVYNPGFETRNYGNLSQYTVTFAEL